MFKFSLEVEVAQTGTWEYELQKSPQRSLCVCYDVPKIDIMQAIENGADSIAGVTAKTYGCQGSQCCERQVQRLIDMYDKDKDCD
ncbi:MULTISPECIES: (2Fe-2S)-binding protein [Thiomicrorhabdus]|uniref:(2Fe-2S)-binding protein n=1 Tax=Thiomicrorhabdus heinhorstiae TaxID=2748010 RepID=A0ABS0BXF0_9GAMM|nr:MULTISPECIES: (2Fe-2S)-binding protein [Thiomicrorhabdus]MBF6057755.1 (2Fe-2S)-binding protein [Thiomicrorhabdus heinhorstiae]